MPLVPDYYGRWDTFIEFIRKLSDSLKDNSIDRTEQRQIFGRWFDDFDQRRKMSLLETFPEFTDFYNLCKGL